MKDCVVACFSDLHLGHKSNDTIKMLYDLRHEIFDKKLLEKIDALFIAGDVFDRLLQLDYPALHEIDTFFAKLLLACKKNDVILRVLEGTPKITSFFLHANKSFAKNVSISCKAG